MIKIAVCDDDENIINWFRSTLAVYFAAGYVEYEINLFDKTKNLIDFINKGHQPDLIFLDILFPNDNGISSAKTIRNLLQNFTLVFITSSDDYAVEGYSVHAYDYLLKPLHRDQVAQILDNLLDTQNMKIDVRIKGSLAEINCMELMYIESDKHHVIFHVHEQAVKAMGKLDNYEDMLKDNKAFLRCHQSYVVNMSFIKEAKGKSFFLKDGSVIPIRKADASEYKAKFYSYLLGVEDRL